MKKTLAIILSIVMAVSMLPITVFGYDGTVKEIDLVRDKAIEVYYEVDGTWDTDSEDEQYFRYNGFIGRGTGDVFTITDDEDNEHYYICDYIDGQFMMCECTYDEEEGKYNIIEGGDSFNYEEIQMIDEQDHIGRHFTLGDDNYFTIEYKGVRQDIQVSVVENPVSAINFIPVSPIKITENTGGEIRTDDKGEEFYYYNPPWFNDGDVLEVTFAGEDSPTIYTYSTEDGSGFFNAEGEELEGDIYTSRYSYERWTVEDGGEYWIKYSGREVSVKVQIIKNTVTAIEYQRTGKDEYIEGDTRYDYWDDAYYYEHPNFREGDVLTVYEGETSTEYICYRDYDTWEFYFETAEGDKRIECNRQGGIFIDDNQRENSWTIDGKNEFYISYMGYTKTLYATVKENPIASITYTRAEPDIYTEGLNGWEEDGIFIYWMKMAEEGDILSVTDKKGKTTEYVCTYNEEEDCIEFVSDDGVIPENAVDISSDQRNNPWKVGSDNEIIITYSGCKYTIYATVEEDTIVSIEYERAEPAEILEGTNGWETQEGEWRYNEPDFLEGDALTINYSDSSAKTYIYRYYEEVGYSAFAYDENDVLEDVRRESEQYETPWTYGGENYYYITYHGKKSAPIKVTIKKNTVTGIDFISAKTPEIFATDTKEIFYPPTGETFEGYELPWFEEGDRLIVHDSEKGDIEYVYTFNEEDGERYFMHGDEMLERGTVSVYEDQYTNRWEVGGEYNFFFVEYLGKRTQVPVNIVESNVESIEYTVADKSRLVLLEENEEYGRWEESWGEQFFFYDFRRSEPGDKLTVHYKDGATSVFTCKDSEHGPYYENAEGKVLDNSQLRFDDNQWDEPWFVDEECFYTVKYKGASFDIPVTIVHDYEKEVIAPTCTKEGCTRYTCKACGEEYEEDHKDALGHKSDKGTVTTKPTYTKEGVKTYKCERCGKTLKKEKIAKLKKKENTIKASGKTVKLKAKDVKSKAQTVKKSKAYSISGDKGTVTFTKSSGNKGITVDKKTGNIKVKKGLKKGTYKVKIKVKAAGTDAYKSKTVSVTVSIVIK